MLQNTHNELELSLSTGSKEGQLVRRFETSDLGGLHQSQNCFVTDEDFRG